MSPPPAACGRPIRARRNRPSCCGWRCGISETAPDGLITATVRHDAIAATEGDGVAPWWSFTKTVIAAAALALVAQGRLALDEPLPGRPFTLRQLLAHRAGLRDYGTLPAYHQAVAAGQPPWTMEDMLRRADAGTLLFPPGEGWAYSNIGYTLVGQLIEAAAGSPLGAALDRLVLQPLDIAGVRLAVTPEDLAATCWGNAAGYHPGWVYHGLLVGRPAAAALLLHRLLAGRLLPPALLTAMRTPSPVGGPMPDRPWRSAGYGLGLMIGDGMDGRFIGHTGGGPGSTFAAFERADCGPDGCTAAAAAALDHPGPVERAAMSLAARA